VSHEAHVHQQLSSLSVEKKEISPSTVLLENSFDVRIGLHNFSNHVVHLQQHQSRHMVPMWKSHQHDLRDGASAWILHNHKF